MKFWKSALLYAATVCTLTAVSCSDETKEPNLYTTAVTDDGNGTAKAAPASAAAGETITLTATPKENFSFAKWTVLSGDAELKSATANPTTFAMPAANVEIKAEFAAVPSQITVTDDGNGTAEANPASAIPGETVTLTATPAENFFFLKWTVLSGGIELENPTENPTTFTLPEGGGNIEIRAEFTDLLSLAASEIIAYDAEKAATVTRLSVGGNLTDEVTAAIFDKFQNLLFLELTDAKAIPDNFMYDAGSRAPKQTKLEELNAPEVTSVGVNAFRNSVLTAVNNSSLRTVHLPKVQTIGERAFSDLWTLEEAVFPELTEVGESAFSQNKALAKAEMPKLTYAPNSLFYSCTALTEISMPNLEEAGSAFFYCGGLTSISLPKLKTAGESCFAYSTKLTQIDIPNVEKLEKMAMYACNGLLSFSGEKVESVGAQCFERCYALKEVSFPAATAFGSGCFIDCESLTKVNFPLCTAINAQDDRPVQYHDHRYERIRRVQGARRRGGLFQSHDCGRTCLPRMYHAQERGSLQCHDNGRLRLLQVLGFHGRAEHAEADRTRQIPLPRMQEYHQGERSGIGEHVLIYVRRMYRSCGHRYARTQEGGKLLFQQMRRFDESGYAHGRDRGRRSVQQLCKYRDGQSPQREKHRWNRLQQLLAHHLHFSSGASDLHRRSIQRNDRPDEL